MQLFQFILKLLANFDTKIKLGVEGRSETFKILSANIKSGDKTLWFHCASLGEFEQGLPVFTEIKKLYKDHKIILTFFSPSGYQIKKESPIADVVCYLPIDTSANARKFIDYLKPELTVFVKYDIWPNYLKELNRKHLKSILISALFRENHPYFKLYGKSLRKALKTFDHIFVQNDNSKRLLNEINITDVTISGDTRFDRVYSQLSMNNDLPWLEKFKDNKTLIIFGSTWPEDEELIIKYLNSISIDDCRFLIVPHEVDEKQTTELQDRINHKSLRYSELNEYLDPNVPILILDAVGHLSKAYAYADIAYIGGATGNSGLHNILEPSVFGMPLIFGNNYSKFPEAIDLVNNGSAVSISNADELIQELNDLIEDINLRNQRGQKASTFILNNKGAVIQIMDYLRI